MRCFFRKHPFASSVCEEDLTKLIKKYDKDGDVAWSFKEFISSLSPLLQFSLKAKDLNKNELIKHQSKQQITIPTHLNELT
jgi:hypothetical protein